MKELSKLKIAYWPCNHNEDVPGDRRRFFFYANKKNVSFEIFNPSSSFDVVLLSQAADIGVIENLKKNNTKVIYDCNNSYHLKSYGYKDIFRGLAKYFLGNNKKLFLNYGNALRKILSEVDGVICASKEQANQLSPYSDNVHCIPDMSSNEVLHVKSKYHSDKVINIAWEGLGSNAYQLNTLKTVFQRFSKHHKFILHVISDRYYYKHMNKFGRTPTESRIKNVCENICFHDWSKETYSKIITGCDIAIIPINPNSNIALGKPENKLILLWKMGMPTITHSTKSYDRVMQEAGINLSCKTNDDWLENLIKLSSEEKLRQSIGKKAKTYTEQNYSEEVILKKWDNLFESI